MVAQERVRGHQHVDREQGQDDPERREIDASAEQSRMLAEYLVNAHGSTDHPVSRFDSLISGESRRVSRKISINGEEPVEVSLSTNTYRPNSVRSSKSLI